MDGRVIDRMVSRIIAPLRRRVQLMVGRAVLSVIDDTKKVQTVKVDLLSDEVSEDVERFQNYGHTAVPFKDCEAVVVFVGGSRAHGIIVATDDRAKRPTGLAEGDSALYNGNGVRVLCDQAADQVLLGNTPAEFVALENLVKAELDALKSTIDTFIGVYNGHIHVTSATIGVGPALGVIAPTVASGTAHGTVGEVAAAEVKAK